MNPTIFKILLISGFSLLISIANSPLKSATLYKWVDANGVVSYQDQPPPKNSKILSEKEVDSRNAASEEEDKGPPEVVVYSVEDCALCEQFVTILKYSKIPYIERPLADDRQAQSRILSRASSIIAPTIFIGDAIIQGGTEEQLKTELRTAGFTIKPTKRAKSSNRLTLDP
jgi:glutaredoxin